MTTPTLDQHGPTVQATERLSKAIKGNFGATALRKGEIDLISALTQFYQTARPGGVGDADLERAVIATFRTILAGLKSSDFSDQFQSGSPASPQLRSTGSPINKGRELVDPFSPGVDLMGVGSELMAKAKAGLNKQVEWTKDTPQDVDTIDHYSTQGSRVQKDTGKPRKASSWSDPTGTD